MAVSTYDGWDFEMDLGSGYVSFKSRVDGPFTHVHGRLAEQELNEDIPGDVLTVRLTNSDKALTPGNPVSPHEVAEGALGRWTETVSGITYENFVGYLKDADTGAWSDDGESSVTFTFVDHKAWVQEQSQPYVSTVGAYIEAQSVDAETFLYYPFNDAGPDFLEASGRDRPMTERVFSFITEPKQELNYQAGPPLPGDDVDPLTIELSTVVGASYGARSLVADLANPITINGSDVATITMWVRRDLIVSGGTELAWLYETLWGDYLAGTGVSDDWLQLAVDHGGTTVIATSTLGAVGAFTTTASVVEESTERWWPVGYQINLGAQTLTLWVNNQSTSIALTPTTPASMTFRSLMTAFQLGGGIAHLMVHVGQSGAYTFTDFLEQRRIGLYGLEWQTTGDRVEQLLSWAGFDASEMDIDQGTSVMQAAQLSGQTIAAAIVDAARTENGDYFMAGRRPQFYGRTRRYNRPADATFLYAWIDGNMAPQLSGPVLNTFEATQADGGPTARSVDQAARTRMQGSRSGQVTINAIVPSETEIAARWRTYNYSASRTRISNLPIDLLHHDAAGSTAVLHAVLGRQIGDRVDLSGMPPKFPVGADKLMIEGWTDICGDKVRRREFVTSPVLGNPPGTASVWLQLDDAGLGKLDNTDHPLSY